MKYKIQVSKKFKKFFIKKTSKEREKINTKLELLKQNPINHPNLDISKMSGFESIFRLRINDYRIIYEVFEKQIIIYIFDVGNRGDIYK
jgi:mRNA interferase RelE/StbE